MTRNVIIGVLVLAIVGTLGATVFLTKKRSLNNDLMDKMYMSQAMYDQQDYDNAIKTLLPVVQEGRRFENAEGALYLLANLYESAQVEQAPEIWERFIQEYPKSARVTEAKLQLAETYLEQDTGKARAVYEELSQSGEGSIKDRALIGIARIYDKENNSEKAKEICNRILENSTVWEVIAEAKDYITKMNNRTLWTPELDEFSELYVVQRGDVPLTIAKKYKTTAYYIEEANHIRGQIHPGKRLKVPKEPLYVVVNKDKCRLSLYTESGKFFKWYPVGVGEQSWKTPAGEYKIINKEIDPVWYKPGGGVIPRGDPENALGVRWMGIGNSLGIHGTNAPETIGFKKSAGCIRMFNEDVIELYKLITYGSRVVIEEGTTTEYERQKIEIGTAEGESTAGNI